MKRNDEAEMSLEDMEKFHDLLNNYLKECFKIQFDRMVLTNVVLPAVSASFTGNVSSLQ